MNIRMWQEARSRCNKTSDARTVMFRPKYQQIGDKIVPSPLSHYFGWMYIKSYTLPVISISLIVNV